MICRHTLIIPLIIEKVYAKLKNIGKNYKR